MIFIRRGNSPLELLQLIAVLQRQKRGESVEYNGFKKRKGIKIHAAVTSEGLPLSIVIGSGAEYDPYRFEEVLGAIKVRTGYRPITIPDEIVADSIYDDAQVLSYLRRRRIKLLFQKIKEIKRREKEEDLEDLVKNRMRKDQQQKGSFQKLKWDLEELS